MNIGLTKNNEILADSNKCPACGGNLIFSVEHQSMTCSFCGGVYSPEKLYLLSAITPLDQEESDEDDDDKHEIICNSCGAGIVADNNTSATACAFCGSPSVITQRLTKKFRPQYLIPFRITKEEAIAKIDEFAKDGEYVPHEFFKSTKNKNITGIYVPFWLMDARCEMHTMGTGYKESFKSKDRYLVKSDITIGLKNVPFDGAVNMKDDLMEAIEPYDCSDVREFNTSYLQGFYSQRYDLSVDGLSDRILARLQRYGKEAAAASLKGYDSFECGACAVTPDLQEQKYVLFPVWLMTYEYKDSVYQIAVNAQTGKTDGDLPVDTVKRNLRLFWYYFVNVLIGILMAALPAAFIYAVVKTLLGIYDPVFVVEMGGLVIILILLLKIMDSSFSRFSIFNPIRRVLTAVIKSRSGVKEKLLGNTDIFRGKRPLFDVYYDESYKAKINTEETFRGHESILADERRS